ncbi:MAG: tyrosine-type recombinase/integrase [Beijerinckiaceae bacterium]|nr:tyrosine-type recombinase/integrase [Beijerinckiaceae bacterium]
MRKHHAQNERIKREYLIFLAQAKRHSEKSVDQAAAAISAFEASTSYRDFRLFRIEQAKRFKVLLSEQMNPATGKPLAKATAHARLMALKAFFQWLCREPGYRKISHGDAEYFNPSANDGRIAAAAREKPAPSLEQIAHVLSVMPHGTDIEKRNRALVACAILTGARDDALASLSLRHIDCTARTVFQDAREVRTKRRKTFTTWFFPVGDEVEAIVAEWVAHLRGHLLFGPDDPLFPATRVAVGESGSFEAMGLVRQHWSNATPIRTIFREAFTAAGLPYFNPHSFRTTLVLLGEKVCRSPEEFKAWSQNLGHEKVLTTFTSYGNVASHRQAEIFAGMRGKLDSHLGDHPNADELRQAMAVIQRVLPTVR